MSCKPLSHQITSATGLLSIREQLREAAIHLAVMVLIFPFIFTAADWLRG
ncbi:hypothetical protein O9Z70_06230 [Devosia sp. YIM 151766]|nr:hypothetical protein [Devosia sp. YIM 151766]WIY54114.1 hypothetical protein O9Z70_06230 [Devosia sp. YIM 151766]